MARLLNGDCLELFKDIPDESIDLVVTDCPYHIVGGGCSNGAYGNQSGISNQEPRKDKSGNKYYSDTKHISLCGVLNDANATTYARQGKLFKHNDIEFDDWLPHLYRVLKKGTHCYIMINPRNLSQLQTSAERVGFKFQQLIVWDKVSVQTPNRYYLNSYELILMLSKRPARNINKMGTKNILHMAPKVGNRMHPTEKPVELMKILVENSSDLGEAVLDPFMGSGSTGVACQELGREFVGFEIDEKYFNIAKERLGGHR